MVYSSGSVVPSNNLQTINKKSQILIYLVLGEVFTIDLSEEQHQRKLPHDFIKNYFRIIPSLRVFSKQDVSVFLLSVLLHEPSQSVPCNVALWIILKGYWQESSLRKEMTFYYPWSMVGKVTSFVNG